MKIKLLANLRIAGKHVPTGTTIDLGDQTAKELIARNVAVNALVDPKAPVAPKGPMSVGDLKAPASEEPPFEERASAEPKAPVKK